MCLYPVGGVPAQKAGDCGFKVYTCTCTNTHVAQIFPWGPLCGVCVCVPVPVPVPVCVCVCV